MKNLKIAFSVLLAVLLIASCTQVRFVEMIPDDGDKKETPISDLPKIVDPKTILKDAANKVDGLSYKVGSSSEAFASRAAGDAGPVYYQMVVSFRGYESANGIISRGTLTFNFEPITEDGYKYKYTANGNGLVVASNTEVRTRRTDAEGLVGRVKGFDFTGDGIVSVTADYKVEVNPYKGSFTSGRDKVTIAESEGVVSGGNGTADSPFIISDLETLKNINEFGDNVSFSLGIDVSKTIQIENKNITFDINGHQINVPDGDGIIVNGGTATILDSGEGTVNANNAVWVRNNGEAIIENGTYKGSSSSLLVGYLASNVPVENAKLTVMDGDFWGYDGTVVVWGQSTLDIYDGDFSSDDNLVIMTNGQSRMSEMPYTINIYGGTYNGGITTEGYIAGGIYMANTGTVTLNGGVFNIVGGVGVVVRSGTLYANNVTINLEPKEGLVSGKVGDSSIHVTTASQIVIDDRAGYPGESPIVAVNNTSYTVKDVDGNSYVPQNN